MRSKQDMKQRWTLQIVEHYLEAQAASGLTKKDYFSSRGFNAATFYYWQQMLRESASISSGFTELKMPVTKEVEVQLASGHWLSIRSTDASILAEVLLFVTSWSNSKR